jgi:hypothetical protein
MNRTISLAKRNRGGYIVYHRGNVSTGIAVYNHQSIKKVGVIVHDSVRDEYKFVPSVWWIMIMRQQECQELYHILKRLNEGERL